MKSPSWLVFALAGAFFAAIVNVLSKRALDAMDSLAALTIQSSAALLTLSLLATGFGRWSTLAQSPRWAIGLIVLSGVFVGAAWACGYRALQLSDVNHATPIDRLSLPIAMILAVIFLPEKTAAVNWFGVALMLVGGYLVTRRPA